LAFKCFKDLKKKVGLKNQENHPQMMIKFH